MAGVPKVQARLEVSEEGGEDSGMGELPEGQIRSQDEARRGASGAEEGEGEAKADQEAIGAEPQGGEEAGKSGGAGEPVGGAAVMADEPHPHDRCCAVVRPPGGVPSV
ncbi:hypothetical protein ABZP36_000898 [Zizania latifolia]